MLDELETPEKNELYKKYFSEAFNMATLPFYWMDTEPEQGKTRYAKDSEKIYRRPPIDLCLEFCEKNGIEPREHALAYEHLYPEWVKNMSKREMKVAMEKHFAEIAERYASRIPTIEVTNETQWVRESGLSSFYLDNEFVEWCYKTAEKYFPNNELVYNEFGMFNASGHNRDLFYMTIDRALRKGSRIDAIGMQYHMFYKEEDYLKGTNRTYNPRHMFNVMDKYSEFNLPLQITEITIPAYSNSPEDEELQAEIIRNIYPIWFSHKNMEQIIYWNLVDGYAAYAPQGDMTAGENYYHGGLLHFDLTPKPAYHVIKDLFTKEWHTEVTIETDDEGKAYFKGFYGDYDLDVNGTNTVIKALKTIREDTEYNKLIKVEV